MVQSKHVVFDIVGTLTSFDAFYDGIEHTIGNRLASQNLNSRLFGYSWMTAAELEFTFLSVAEGYKPYKEILRALFFRTLHMAGVENPHQFATAEERDQLVQSYSELELRPGTKECFDILRDAGFTIWCLTTGDAQRVAGYFERSAVDMPPNNIVSCDKSGLAKPSLAVYRSMFEGFASTDIKFFAAAHMWDVSAAVKVGFLGAYCSILEREPCEEIFETKMEVISSSLPHLANEIVAKASEY